MAKVTGLNVPSELKAKFEKFLKANYLRLSTKIDMNPIFGLRSKKERLSSNVNLNDLAPLWDSLSSSDQTLWGNAGAESGLTGYQLFVQDTSYRLNNGLTGLATPNNYHQYKVLSLEMSADIGEWSIIQEHFDFYYLRSAVSGRDEAFEWNLISEVGSSPLKIEFNYYSDLVSTDPDSDFYVKVTVHGLKNGLPVYDSFNFDLDLQTGWKSFSEELVVDMDSFDEYDFTIQAYYLTGTFRADNFNFEHDSQNWAWDPYCKNILDEIIYSYNEEQGAFVCSDSYEADFFGSKYI